MSYPFLPVNPCCTDVVLNDPCGCSSTTSNTGCRQNICGTNVIVSSNVIYNGPALDCIVAEPCDTINVILQKIDEIICNLLVQINTLNIQVENITEQIISIESNVITINNTLSTCCGATSTTTTTTTVPVPTYCYTLTAIGRIIFYWIDVNGDPQFLSITDGTIYVCAQLDSIGTAGDGVAEINGGITECTSDEECVITTTTTTTVEPSTTTTTSTTIEPTTTTTTTIPPSTTTTTTVVHFEHGFSEGKTDNNLACAETVVAITLYTSVPTIVFGTFVYTDPGLTIPFDGGVLFYKNISVNNGIRTSSIGQVNSLFSC
jgi:hypothetical protein